MPWTARVYEREGEVFLRSDTEEYRCLLDKGRLGPEFDRAFKGEGEGWTVDVPKLYRGSQNVMSTTVLLGHKAARAAFGDAAASAVGERISWDVARFVRFTDPQGRQIVLESRYKSIPTSIADDLNKQFSGATKEPEVKESKESPTKPQKRQKKARKMRKSHA